MFADTCRYMVPGSSCNVATLKCKNSNVPCNTSDTDQRAKQLLRTALYFDPPVGGVTQQGGPLHAPGKPFGAGYDSYSFR